MDVIDSGTVSNGVAAWSAILTAVLGYMGFTVKKQDADISANTKSISAVAVNLERVQTKTAETYATKATMMDLYKETTRTNEAAIARVEDSVKQTNATIVKQGEKLDSVKDSIHTMQTSIMNELVKKT